MTYRTYRRAQATSTSGQLVSPRQMAALGKMAEANGFTSGSALLADIASCTQAELGRKSRSVVQMFVDLAFERYGTRASGSVRRGRCEDAPCCGCCG